MSDILIRTNGRAGHITLNRPKALNALTWDMCLAIETALDGWRDNDQIDLILIDAAGDRAFCSGGDIAEMYATAKQGDYDYGRRFWRDEYRLNAKISNFPKHIVSFLQGYTMGGGVGVGCHAGHRVVGDTSQIAMPECSIGLVPDVGGSLLLARAPGHCGEYLGLTGDRMDAGDAIHAEFADHYIPENEWDDLKSILCQTGDTDAIGDAIHPAPRSRLQSWQAEIDACFASKDLGGIFKALETSSSEPATLALKKMSHNAPLGMAVAHQIIGQVRQSPKIETALDHEFRYTFRCGEQGDFVEGIRAAIIDRDRQPKWQHDNWNDIDAADVRHMTAPLGDDALVWED